MNFNIVKLLVKKMSCASLFGAQGIFVPKANSMLLEAASAEIQDFSITLKEFLNGVLDMFLEAIISWVYIISKYILMFIDFCQVITYKIAGIDSDLEKIVDQPIFRLILNDKILSFMGTILILGLLILVVASIVAIVKSEFKIALEDKGDKKSAAYKVLGKSAVSIFLTFVTPFILIVAVIFSSVILSSVNNLLNSNKTQHSTLGGTLFVSSAYHANKYRMYAADGKRIPVIFNFDDPYQSGLYEHLSTEELHEIYESFNGEQIYDNFTNQNFLPFNETVTYRNGKLYNSNSYSEYERFVATAEQYNVMADFIDYAMAHEIKFYIKDSKDKEIDWERTSSDIKITNGVFDVRDNSLSITYVDMSDLAPGSNEYTITFETGTASAETPIETAVATISLILGLNTFVNASTGKDFGTATGLLNNSSLIDSAKNVEDIINQLALDASSNSSVEFRMLERVKGSGNLVRWRTEKALYDGAEYTVYELKKIVVNQKTGNPDVRATVKVAKKDDSLNNRYFVVSDEKNEDGYYEHTNIEIDYYNNGSNYLDTLEPIFKKATWPEKLYNDLMVIYSDIDFDNYISYDNWADELGTYFKTGENVSSSDVSSFSTTLIHPLGLIMGELFLGLAIEDENGSASSFSFTSAYLDDIINSLAISLTNQYDYENAVYQIENFSKLFNKQFASVIESLQKIEGFDIYGTDELSVQGYVYKAYLASIMLSTDYGEYLYDISYKLVTAEKLVELMKISSNQVTYDKNGNIVYQIKRIQLENGQDAPLLFGESGTSRAVYNSAGKKVYAVNGLGILNYGVVKNYLDNNKLNENSSMKYEYFIPQEGTKYIIENEYVARNLILGKAAVGVESPHSGHFNLSYYAVYSVKLKKYIPVYDLYFGTFEEYNEAKTKPENVNLEWFGDYFETYFDYDNDNGNLNVYKPVDEDTQKDRTEVFAYRERTITSNLIGTNIDEWVYKNADVTFTNYIIDQISVGKDPKTTIQGIIQMDELYFIYEVEKVVATTSSYLTYDKLPKVYRDYIDTMITTIEDEIKLGKVVEPFFLKFLKEYQQNGEYMNAVMNADEISADVAEDLTKVYDMILDEIAYYEDALLSASNESEVAHYTRMLNFYQTSVNQIKKYYIVYGIESFASSQVSSSFTVIVNNHAYNISQGVSKRELMETIMGNRITYKTLLAKISNGTDYNELGKLDQSLYDQIVAFARIYMAEAKQLVVGDINTCELFKGNLNDLQVEILEAVYETQTGTRQVFTNQKLSVLSADKKTEIYTALNKSLYDLEKIIDNYSNGRVITDGGLISAITEDTAYKLLHDIINVAVGEQYLFHVDEDYEGLIADDLSSFNLLRDFLKSFGDLCFDLARKSNLGNIGKADDKDLLLYINQFTSVLNQQIESVNLGSSVDLITRITSLDDITYIDEIGEIHSIIKESNQIQDGIYFSSLSNRSKDYIQILYEYYKLKVEKYEQESNGYSQAQEYVERYKKGRYAMQSNSFIYETGLKEYLNWFRYNVAIDNIPAKGENPDTVFEDEEFIKKYIYHGYEGYDGVNLKNGDDLIFNHDERLLYYNLYLDAFGDTVLGKDGLYFEALTPIQQKVIQDMVGYYNSKYNEFVTKNELTHILDVRKFETLDAFINHKVHFDEEFIDESGVKVSNIIYSNENVNSFGILNLFNMLDYIGLEFKVDKTLNEYRLDAINALISFKERSGESGASIQARYLTLLYIACSDYVKTPAGDTIIQISSSTKSTILELAGLKDMPEEQLVGLEFEIANDEAGTTADEKYGSVFIICTYNSETQMYEPFVFASEADGKGTPHTDFYASDRNGVRYYPVIAKGVIGPDGRPTAIREVNGYIEFYRENVTIMDAGELNLEMYYMSMEDISIKYNPVNIVINGITKLFTGKSAAEHLIDAFPAIIKKDNLKFCYGVMDSEVWHLENGGFELNYMFYNDTAIAMNCLYDMRQLNVIILALGTLILATALIKALFGVIGNLYELAIVIMVYPGVFALYPLTEDPQKKWREMLINKILIMLGYVLAINGFFLILNLLQRMDLQFVFSQISVEELKNTYIFNLINVEAFITDLVTVALFLVAAVLLNTLPKMFSKAFKVKDEPIKKGGDTRELVKTNMQEAAYLSSGYAVDDMISSKIDMMRNIPLVGSQARAEKRENKQIAQNKLAVQNYARNLEANGISQEVAAKAVETYEKSLNRQLEAVRERRNANREARIVRINRHKARIQVKEKKDEPVTCPKCKAVYQSKKKTKQCKYCGHKFKK